MTTTDGGSSRDALLLGLVHASIDGACAFVLFRDVSQRLTSLYAIIAWIVVYSAVAFAGQLPLGLMLDRGCSRRRATALGVALTVIALAIGPISPPSGAVVAGVGNALFHVGAGAHVLAISGRRARESGFFVGPGAVGLWLGIILGRGTLPCRLGLAALLVLGGFIAWKVIPGRVDGKRWVSGVAQGLTPPILLGGGLLVAAVMMRSLTADNVVRLWRSSPMAITLGLAVAACVGKMLGGIVADRVGWRVSAGMALLLGAVLMAVGVTHPVAAIGALLLVQLPMPVTLKAIHNVLPERPGLAFGLSSAALVVGAAPGLFSLWLLDSWQRVLTAGIVSAAVVVAGLSLLRPPPSVVAADDVPGSLF